MGRHVRAVTLALGTVLLAPALAAARPAGQVMVVFAPGHARVADRAAHHLDGRVIRANPVAGYAVIRTRAGDPRARLAGVRGVQAVLRVSAGPRPVVRRAAATRAPTSRALAKQPPVPDPLQPLQWNLGVLRVSDARDHGSGRPDVLVGVIDTGIDGSHPDLTANLDLGRSRDLIPGGAADRDATGHGTHLAGLVAAADNGTGMAGVAPGVRLVSLRAVRDDGRLDLAPALDALTTAADLGVDVVVFGAQVTLPEDDCSSAPAARAARLAAARVMQRTVDAARDRGVTVVSGTGDTRTELTPGADRCIMLPAETHRVIAVGATGPSGRKAEYANHGAVVRIAAPGGDRADFPDDPLRAGTPENMVLSAYPTTVARAAGQLDPMGVPLDPVVVRACDPLTGCSYYRWAQGTAVAAAQVAGVAALVVSRYGGDDPDAERGRTMVPGDVGVRLRSTAAPVPCPDPPVVTYPDVPGAAPVPCVPTGDGGTNLTGAGMVDAAAATGIPRTNR